MNKKELTVEEIVLWILENKDDIKKMDTISNVVFTYTSKYKSYYVKEKQEDYRG